MPTNNTEVSTTLLAQYRDFLQRDVALADSCNTNVLITAPVPCQRVAKLPVSG
jgi:hypothetical protein